MLANDTEYGLAAYFYTKDLRRAWRIAEQLEYGMVRKGGGGLGSCSCMVWGLRSCCRRGFRAGGGGSI